LGQQQTAPAGRRAEPDRSSRKEGERPVHDFCYRASATGI
jgi:hypothetical protein